MSEIAEPKWYRSLKGYKYATKIPRSCAVKDLPVFEHEFFRCTGGSLFVKPYYAWDGPSGPTWDRKKNMRPSLFHDVLCQAISEGLLAKKYRKYADELFRQHLLKAGMKPWLAWCYYKCVRGYSRLKGM